MKGELFLMKDKAIPSIIAKNMYHMHTPDKLKKEISIIKSGLIQPGFHVLDIGCGPGYLSVEMAKETGNLGIVYSLDIHPIAIETLQSLIKSNNITNIKPILTDTITTGLNDLSIDIVFIFNTIDMIRDKTRLVLEIDRILKKGGHIVIRNKLRIGLFSNKYNKLFRNTSIKLIKTDDHTFIFCKQA